MDPARSTAVLLRLWRRLCRLSVPRTRTRSHLDLGRWGEKLAARHLRRVHGFRILYRNFRSKFGGEIDLVCRDRKANTLVFVEVKTRASDAFGAPRFAVTWAKQRRIIKGARAWLRLLNSPEVLYRFDVVEVVVQPKPEVRLIRNAFQVPDDIYH
ncbi:MAG TPA: YraN family protein [Chthoniobacterales bacterium]